MGKRTKGTVTNSKKLPVAGSSGSVTKTIPICSIVIVAVLGCALYHLFSIEAHLDWIYTWPSPPTAIEVERYVLNDSVSYQ